MTEEMVEVLTVGCGHEPKPIMVSRSAIGKLISRLETECPSLICSCGMPRAYDALTNTFTCFAGHRKNGG